jgi:surface antigen
MVIGGVTGGLIGSAFKNGDGKTSAAAVGIGAVLGAVIGSNIGKSMDEHDKKMAEQAASEAVQSPVGQKVEWNNPNTGNSGSAKTLRIGKDSSGHECRQIEQEITVNGKSDVVQMTVCLIDDHWVVSS